MSHELANVHLGTGKDSTRAEIRKHLKDRDPIWLLVAAEKACDLVRSEQQKFERHWRRSRRKA